MDIIAIDDHVAEVNSDPKVNGVIAWYVCGTLRHPSLHDNRAFDSGDNAGKLQQKAITGGLHDPTAMFFNEGIDELGAVGFQRRKCPAFVSLHEAAVAGPHGRSYARLPRVVKQRTFVVCGLSQFCLDSPSPMGPTAPVRAMSARCRLRV